MAEHSSTDNVHTRKIAEFVSGVRYEQIPADVRERLKLLLILNSLGCAIYGANLEWCRIVQTSRARRHASAPSPATATASTSHSAQRFLSSGLASLKRSGQPGSITGRVVSAPSRAAGRRNSASV